MSARLLAAIVILAAASITACFFSDGYQVFVIANVALTAIVAIGLNVLLGLAGQISLGHVGFYAIGAYTCGILTTRHEWDFWAAFPIAGLLAALAGALLAMPALRVRGPYLAMVTIAFGFVVEQSAAELRDFTGGWNGLMGIPRPALGGFAFEEISLAVFAIALAAVLLILFARLRDSTWGLAMRATRDAEVASQAIGLNLVAVRTVAFTLSAFLAGLAGALFASLNQFISPESFPFFQSITFLLVVLVGGAGTVLSPVVGSMIVVLLPEMLAFLAEYRLLFFGSLLLVVLWLAPEGIMGKLEPWLAPRRGAAEPASEAEVEAFLRRDDPVPLSTHDLSIAFGGTRAVDGVRLTAGPGAVTSIIGPNGAGKTTLLNLISGFYKPDRGRAQLGATPLPRGSTHLVARAGVARTFQTTQLFPRMTVLENLLIAMRLGRLGGLHRALAGPDDEARARLAAGLLRFVGYAGPVECPAAALAHVDRRLVEVARALALGPRVVTLDEPAAGLNDADTARLGELLRRMGSLGIAVVIIEHDMNLVMGFSDRVTVLDAGRMIAEGDPAAVRADPGVRAAYLGEGELRIERGARSAEAPAPVLEVEDLATGYGALPVLEGIGLRVGRGELVALLGTNGAGKTTLMRAITGLHRPISGRVLLLGERIQSLAAYRIAREGLALVPEGRQVFPELSVADNIALGCRPNASSDATVEVERLLERFSQLKPLRDKRAGLLSGGEQQMLAIARGLAARPTILLLDEPSLGLAPAIVESLYRVLEELRREGATLLLVDQMARLALSVADRAYVLKSGRIVHEGGSDEIRSDPNLERAYLG